MYKVFVSEGTPHPTKVGSELIAEARALGSEFRHRPDRKNQDKTAQK